MSSPPVTAVRRSFSDVEEMADAVLAWKLDFHQLEPGTFEGELEQVVHADHQVTRGTFGRALRTRGASPAGMYTIVLVAEERPTIWRERPLPPGSTLVFGPGSEIDGVCFAGHEGLAVAVSTSALGAAAERLGIAGWREKLAGLDSTVTGPDLIRRVRAFARGALNGAAGETTAEEAALYVLEVARFGAALPAADTGFRIEAVRRSDSLLRAEPSRFTAVWQLAEETGVSERSLEYAYRQFRGLAPKKYLSAVRLNEVRRLLRASSPSALSVADAAGRVGFRHMGQFAADYRRMFGELPSHTLRRTSAKTA